MISFETPDQNASSSAILNRNARLIVDNEEGPLIQLDNHSNPNIIVNTIPLNKTSMNLNIEEPGNQKDSFLNAWKKPHHIKINFDLSST